MARMNLTRRWQRVTARARYFLLVDSEAILETADPGAWHELESARKKFGGRLPKTNPPKSVVEAYERCVDAAWKQVDWKSRLQGFLRKIGVEGKQAVTVLTEAGASPFELADLLGWMVTSNTLARTRAADARAKQRGDHWTPSRAERLAQDADYVASRLERLGSDAKRHGIPGFRSQILDALREEAEALRAASVRLDRRRWSDTPVNELLRHVEETAGGGHYREVAILTRAAKRITGQPEPIQHHEQKALAERWRRLHRRPPARVSEQKDGLAVGRSWPAEFKPARPDDWP